MVRRQQGDPWDVLDLAVSSLRLIGGILLLLAALGVLTLVVRLRLDRLFDTEETIVHVLVSVIPYILAGGCFLLTASFLKRRHAWAAAVAICLTSGTCLLALLLLASLLVLVQTPRYASAWMAIPILLVASFAFASGQLVFHLTKTLKAIRQLHDSRPANAFELIARPRAVLPATPTEGESDAASAPQ